MALDSLGVQNSGYGLNDDFMAQQYFKSLNTQTAGVQQNSYQAAPVDTTQVPTGLSFQGGLQTDTFQKSNNNGLYLAGLGTVGAAGAGYYFANPFEKENVFKDRLIKTANSEALVKETEKLLDDKTLEYVKKQYKVAHKQELSEEAAKAIEKFNKGEKITTAEKKVLADAGFKSKNKNFSPKALNKFLEENVQKSLDKNNKKILKEIKDALDKKNFVKLEENLANNKVAKALIEGLEDKAKVTDIENLIKENPTAFGIKETEEAKIAKEAKKLAKGKNKAAMKTAIEGQITAAENAVKNQRNVLNGNLLSHWDKDANAFKKEAPEAFSKGLKNFKWREAGKWGLIVAGVGLALNWAFGGNKS